MKLPALPDAYLDPLPVDSLCTAANWEVDQTLCDDPLSASLKRVMTEREKFYLTVGRDEVDRKLEKKYAGCRYGSGSLATEKADPV